MPVRISKNRFDAGDLPIKNIGYGDYSQIATPSAPAANKTRLYSKNDGKLYIIPAGGSETAVLSGAIGGVPTNGIIHTTDSSAPTGFTEYTAARGRFLVGVPSGGTIAGTVGTALTNQQDLTHTHTGPSHTHNTPIGYGTDLEISFTGGSRSMDGYHFTTGDASPPGDSVTQVVTDSAGTGATGTAATSNVAPYIQLFTIQKT